MKRIILLLSCCAWFGVNQSVAEEFSWHGYVAQGVTQSKDSNFITDNEDVNFDLTEIGLNGRYQISNGIALVGQGVYLNGGNRFETGGRLDYLFLDLKLPTFGDWHNNMHLGRYKNVHWFYSATRDVPQTRDTAVLPQSMYLDSFRDIGLGSDGVLLQSSILTDQGGWELNWSYGRSPISADQTKSFLGDIAQGKGKQDYVHQASVFWRAPTLDWRVGLSWLESKFSYEPAAVDFLLPGNINIEKLVFGVQKFAETWELTSEITRTINTLNGTYAPNFYTKRTSEGGYIQGRYFINGEWSVLGRYDTTVLDKNDRSGKVLSQTFGVPPYFGYMDTYTVGARWDPQPQWRVQAEYHWVNGAARFNGLLNAEAIASTDENWEMWSVQVMYWF